MAKHYVSPEAFKAALEQRLRNTSKDGSDFACRRQFLVFDRFLARIVIRHPNTRVKDLPDIALLGTAQSLDAKSLRQAFSFRKTHDLPSTLPSPLTAWATPYKAMASEDDLAWPTLDKVTKAAQSFLDPVFAGGSDATWSPSAWLWMPGRKQT